VSAYHLGGFSRLHGNVARTVSVTALVTWVSEAFQAECFYDPRLAKRVDEVEGVVDEEFEYIRSLPHEIFCAMANLLDDVNPHDFRSEVIDTCSIERAFIQKHAFEPARELPWSLCNGDIRENCKLFMQGPKPDEDASSNIHTLFASNINFEQCCDGVDLMGDMPWSIGLDEQLHNVLSTVKKSHKRCELETMTARSFVGMLRPLVTPSEYAKKDEKLLRKKGSLEHRRPENLRADNLYYREALPRYSIDTSPIELHNLMAHVNFMRLFL